MEETITRAIVTRYFEKLKAHLALDVAIVGAGPSGLVAARDLATSGKRVAVFERALAPGGGVWGGGMLMNEVVVQSDALPVLEDFRVRTRPFEQGFFTVDSVELAAGLVFGAVQAGAAVFNAISVEDIVFRDDRVAGLVVNWAPVQKTGMHVDPLVVTARAVLDGTGHPAEVVTMACRKAGVRIDTETGTIMGERPMWMEKGEASTVANTKRLWPGLYASGMAANNASGGARMGPIFGGMLLSGRKAATLIARDLDG
ncbi:MAG: sulfide-dependent adenosine diphosphate thiazole synthase [Coriobacteriia bacterium]